MEVLSSLVLTSLIAVSGLSFDVPAIAPAYHLVEAPVTPQLPNSRFVEVSFDVTTNVPATFQGAVREIIVEVRSNHEDVQVADYAPKTETYSTVDGTIRVMTSYNQKRNASIDATGFYPVFASAKGHASFEDEGNRVVEQNEVAAQQLLTAAGTLDRRTGVYFKLRANPQTVIEGARRFSLLLEVPLQWRADLLDVRTYAFGVSTTPFASKSEQLLSSNRYHVAVYQVGDEQASYQALEFNRQHVRLQTEAIRYANEVERRSSPTPIHQIGTALNLMKPIISENWLEEWVFGSQYQKPYPSLPVNLKVAMLDFQDARTRLLAMSRFSEPSTTRTHQVGYRPTSSSSATMRTR